MSKIFVDQVDPKTATTLTLGTTGDTVDIPSGVTLSGAGTITASAANLAASGAGGVTGTLPIANGGTGATTLAAAGLASTPSFKATMGVATSLVDESATKLAFNTEVYDTDAAYDTSAYRFTPVTTGKYLVSASVGLDTAVNGTSLEIIVKLNGSSNIGSSGTQDYYNSACVSGIVNITSASDYIEAFGYQNTGGDKNANTSTSYTFFSAHKLIGV